MGKYKKEIKHCEKCNKPFSVFPNSTEGKREQEYLISARAATKLLYQKAWNSIGW